MEERKMKKLTLLMAMAMVIFCSGSVVSAQYHPREVKWYGKCSKENGKQKNFSAKFLEDVRILPVHQQRHSSLANWHKVQKQDKAKRQRTLARQRNKAEWQRMLAKYRSSAIRN